MATFRRRKLSLVCKWKYNDKKKKVRFRDDGDDGSQKTSGKASAEQNHASWNVDKLRCLYRSPRLMATHRLPRDERLVAAVAESPQNVLAGGPAENMGRPMGYTNRCSLARFAAGMPRYRPNVRNGASEKQCRRT
jgi:hypothetical protein